MPEGTVGLTKNDITEIALLDGTGTPVELALIYADASFSMDDFQQVFEPIVLRFGHTLLGVRKGARKDIPFSFSTYHTSFTSAAVTDAGGNPWDFANIQNGFSGNTNTNTSGYDYPLCSVRVTMVTNSVSHIVLMNQCMLLGVVNADEPNKIDWSGTCYGTITPT